MFDIWCVNDEFCWGEGNFCYFVCCDGGCVIGIKMFGIVVIVGNEFFIGDDVFRYLRICWVDDVGLYVNVLFVIFVGSLMNVNC